MMKEAGGEKSNDEERPSSAEEAAASAGVALDATGPIGESRRFTTEMAILLALAVALVYVPALRAGFIWDDGALIENPLVRSARGVWLIWTHPRANANYEPHYWPLVYTAVWLEQKIWGLQPFGYHLVNVLLHGLNSILLWRLLRRLRLPAAWLAAAIFALHPVHAEAVAWIIEQKDLLSAFFYLTAFLAYIRFESSRSALAYLGSLALFLGAMLSKSVAVSLPLALAVWLWWKGGRLTARDALALAPFLALGAAVAGFDAWLASAGNPVPSGLSFVERGLLAGRALWFYSWKLFWPANLMTFYPRWEIDARSVWAWAYPAGVAAVLAALWAKRRTWGRGPLAAVLFFAFTLGPALGFVDFSFMNHSFVADRFQYLAGIGLIVLASIGWERVSGKFLLHGAEALLLVLGVLTWRQARHYADLETLFRYNLAENPFSWGVHNGLGVVLTDQKRYDDALKQYDIARALNPGAVDPLFNQGWTFHLLGRLDEAIARYREVLSLMPSHYRARLNLADALRRKGQFEQAIQWFHKALEVMPDDPVAHACLGLALCQAGKTSEGVEEFHRALRIDPNCRMARENLSRYAAGKGERP